MKRFWRPGDDKPPPRPPSKFPDDEDSVGFFDPWVCCILISSCRRSAVSFFSIFLNEAKKFWTFNENLRWELKRAGRKNRYSPGFSIPFHSWEKGCLDSILHELNTIHFETWEQESQKKKTVYNSSPSWQCASDHYVVVNRFTLCSTFPRIVLCEIEDWPGKLSSGFMRKSDVVRNFCRLFSIRRIQRMINCIV